MGRRAVGLINYRLVDLYTLKTTVIQKRYGSIETLEEDIKKVIGGRKERIKHFGKRGLHELVEIISIACTIEYSKYLNVNYASLMTAKIYHRFNDWNVKYSEEKEKAYSEVVNKNLTLSYIKEHRELGSERKSVKEKYDSIADGKLANRETVKRFEYSKPTSRLEVVEEFMSEKNVVALNVDDYKNNKTILKWECKDCNHKFEDNFYRVSTRTYPCPNCKDKIFSSAEPVWKRNLEKVMSEMKIEIVDLSNYSLGKRDASLVVLKCKHGKKRATTIKTVKRKYTYGTKCPICDK